MDIDGQEGRGGHPRHRMSRRGRATVAALALLVSIGVGWLVGFGRPGPPTGPGDLALPSVGAGADRGGLPSELFERLPVGLDDLHRASMDATEAIPARWSEVVDRGRLVDWVDAPAGRDDLEGPLRIEYSMDAELTRKIFEKMRRGRVARGHVIVMDPNNGRVIAYASSDPAGFPGNRPYPAASLVKIVTAAAALHENPEQARRPCRYRGNPYRLTRSRLRPAPNGNEMSLERALATSNNQCFAQLAVNVVGSRGLLDAFASFGLVESPAPGHAPGMASAGDDDYDLGRLGCGLGGCRITPLHAVQLAATLVRGERVEPWWIDRIVDGRARSLPLPPRRVSRRVMTERMARELREMLVRTTTRGTARSAFRDRRGRPRLGDVRVAGKTGNLSGNEPKGRYEWFIGVAPARAPTVAVAVVQLQGHLWWTKSSQVAADVFAQIFCDRRGCSPEHAGRYTGALNATAAPVFLSDDPHPPELPVRPE